MNKTSFRKILSIVLVCAALIGALVGITVSAESTDRDITVSKNVWYADTMRLMFAIPVEEVNEGETVSVNVYLANGDLFSATTLNTELEPTKYIFIANRGFAAQDINTTVTAKVTVSSGNEVVVEKELQYSVLEYVYKMLLTKKDCITDAQEAMLNSLLTFAKASEIRLYNELENVRPAGSAPIANAFFVHTNNCTVDGDKAGIYKLGDVLNLNANTKPNEYAVWHVQKYDANGVLGEDEIVDGEIVVDSHMVVTAEICEKPEDTIDPEILSAILDEITFDRITENTTITLPTTYEAYENVVISWNLDECVGASATLDGNVLNVALGDAEGTVTLTATAAWGSVSSTKTYTVNVDMSPEKIAAIISEIIAGIKFNKITSDATITLPAASNDYADATIVWTLGETVNATANLNGNTLKITRGESDGTVEVKATVSYKGASANKTYTLNVSAVSTATLTFDADKANRTEFSNDKQVWAQNGITFTNNKASSTTNIADYGNPVRLYKSSQITIEYAGMTKIVFYCTSGYANGLSSGSISGTTVTFDFGEVKDSYTITIGEQTRVSKIVVYTACSHDLVEVSSTNPTCTEKGTSVQKCTNCGETKTTETPANGHTEGDKATCTTAQICTVCQTELVAALGHDFANATCEAPKTCKTCGATEGEALGHNWTDATCEAPKTCKNCGETEGEALGHNFENGSCTKCGEADPDVCIHTEWAEATCTTPKTCKNCGETEGTALGHTEGPVATCTTAQICTACQTELVAALGHNFENGSCTKCGEADPSAPQYEDKKYSYTFTAKQFTANGLKTLNGLSWTITGSGSYWGYDGTKGQQFGSGSAPYKTLTVTSGTLDNVTEIKINTSGASSINAQLTVTVGGKQIGSTVSLTTSATTYTFKSDTPLSGAVVLTYTQTSSKAIYIKSIEIAYQEKKK